MAQNWSSYVNTKFYGLDGEYKDNTEEVKFKGGRVIRYLINSHPKKVHQVSLRCKDKGTEKKDGKTEFEWLLYWYENIAKSGTEPIYLTDIVTGIGTKRYYIKLKNWRGQRFKEVGLEIEEL